MVGGQGESAIKSVKNEINEWKVNIIDIQLWLSFSITGNVLSHHKTIKDLEQYYSSTMADNKDVKNFLKNITSDKEG